jgi:hypothetical protein
MTDKLCPVCAMLSRRPAPDAVADRVDAFVMGVTVGSILGRPADMARHACMACLTRLHDSAQRTVAS